MSSNIIASDHFSPDVAEFIRLLGKWQVRYLVVGGEAVIFHGYPRLTGDIDFYFESNSGNVEKLYEALREFWDGSIPGLERMDELLEPGIILQFGRPPNRIDLMNSIDGIAFGPAWDDRVVTRMQMGTEMVVIPYLSLPALLKNKLASGRPRDLDDHENLRPHAGEVDG